jgi:ABC-type phosphate/phosphonate transport system substrate-binding protein
MVNMELNPFRRLLAFVLGCLCCIAAGAADSSPAPADAGAADSLRIGVLAYRGVDMARKEWQPHANYLAAKLAPRQFRIVPLTLAEFEPAIQ